MSGLSQEDLDSIKVLNAAAPPLPIESQRRMAAILGPAYAEVCREIEAERKAETAPARPAAAA